MSQPITNYDDHLCTEVLYQLDEVYDLGDWRFLLDRFSHRHDTEYADVLGVSRDRVWRRKAKLVEAARAHLSEVSRYQYDEGR